MRRVRLLLAVAMTGSLPLTYLACVGDSSVGSDGGGPDGGDSGSDSMSLGCPLGCLPPAPSGWTGPSAVYDGPPGTKPSACPTAYTQKEIEAYQGVSSAAADCDCGAPAFVGASCSANVEIFSGAGCTGGLPLLENTITLPGTNCITTTHSGYVEVTAAALTPGTCSFPTPSTVLADASVTAVDISCGLPQNAACATSASCVATPVPDAPFTRLCIHHDGDMQCPNADYSKRFVAYTSITDTRACSACTGTASGACGATWGSVANTGLCSTSPFSTYPTGTCGSFQYGIGTVIGAAVAPTNQACAMEGGTPQGDASAANPVTFCCNK